LIAVSAADPLNLVGVLTPSPRIATVAGHRILLRDGIPVAVLKAWEVFALNGETEKPERSIETSLRVGIMPPQLRPYYA